MSERTEIFYGEEDSLKVKSLVSKNTEKKLDVCIEAYVPRIIFESGPLKQIIMDAIARGIKPRYITEINHENIRYCKQLEKIVEVRHLDGIKGNFAVTDTEYTGVVAIESQKPNKQTIYSNNKAIVEQHKYIFTTLWKQATPAKNRIREIVEGVIANHKIEVLHGVEDCTCMLAQVRRNAKKNLDICGNLYTPQITINFERQYKEKNAALSDLKNRGVKIRYLTEIVTENLEHCRDINGCRNKTFR